MDDKSKFEDVEKMLLRLGMATRLEAFKLFCKNRVTFGEAYRLAHTVFNEAEVKELIDPDLSYLYFH